MSEHHTRSERKADDISVAELASRAVSLLVSQRAKQAPDLADRLLSKLVETALHGSPQKVDIVVAEIISAGFSEDDVLSHFITEAARRVGADWCEDGLGFAEVTIACARLQRALHEISPPHAKAPVRRDHGPRALVAVPHNEHHTLGALVATAQLRRAGVSVRLLLDAKSSEISDRVMTGQYDAVLLSLASVDKLEEISQLIDKLRVVMREPIPVCVGGSIMCTATGVKEATGADHASADPFEVLHLCGLKVLGGGNRHPARNG